MNAGDPTAAAGWVVGGTLAGIELAVQTALREAVGVHTLAELLSQREHVSLEIQNTLAEKTKDWGISVKLIEIRDIVIPPDLKDALSRQAQAEREREARTIRRRSSRAIHGDGGEAMGLLRKPFR